MNSKLIAGIIVIFIVAGGVFLFFASDPNDSSETVTTQTTESQESTPDTSQSESEQPDTTTPLPTFTLANVAEHATEDDCWTVVDGNVYDITSYVPRHPGGDTILLACGGDGSSLFNSRTTDQGETVGSGTAHSSNAARQLSSLQIGILAE